MIESLVTEDLITFYEIYELYDKINLFSSNYEEELYEKLSEISLGIKNISYGISNLISSIQLTEYRIINELSELSYVTESSYNELQNNLGSDLRSINSSLDVNNLLTGISTYQLYKINKQTKGLTN